MTKKQIDVPFNGNGDQVDYPCWIYNRTPEGVTRPTPGPTMPNFEFEDTLTFESYGKGRSSVTFYMKRESTGKGVTMFISDFTDALPKMVNGKITGKFTFCKKGQSYGCKLLTSDGKATT